MKRHTSFPRENQSAVRTKQTQTLSVLAAVAAVATHAACGEEARIQPEVSSKPAPSTQGRLLSETDDNQRAEDFAKNIVPSIEAAQATRWVQQYASHRDSNNNDEILRKVSEEVLRSLEEQRPIRILITWDDQELRRIEKEMGLDDENIMIKGTNQVDPEKLATRISIRQQFYATYRDAFVNSIWGQSGKALTGSQIVHQYDNFPVLAATLTSPDALQKIAASPIVRLIGEETFAESSLASSLPLVNHSTATGKGAKGRGTTVVVLDTGTDYTLADFGSCTVPGAPSTCRISVAQDLAAEDNNLDDNGHGTNVSAIVLGVAPDAKVASFDVFNGATASSIDVLKGVDWAITNKVQENVVSINMSLGAGKFTAACPNDVYEAPIANAKTAGIVTVIASGNNKFLNALASPACAPSAVSVGAVYSKNFGSLATATCTDASTAADKVTCFSNSASFLTLLAPGAKITAGGRTLVGTSQAAPHVAGAVALVRSPGFLPTDTATAIIDRLKNTGRATRDARNNITKPRLDLGALIPTPAAVPSISLVINNGATFTGSTTVQALVSAVDANQNSNISEICVSTDAASCSNFVPFVAGSAIDVAISSSDGEKTLFAFARSPAGTVSTTPASDAIIFDGAAPVDGSHSQEAIVDGVALSWSGFADAASGVGVYRVYQSNSSAVAACDGVLAYQGSDTQTNLAIPSDVGTTFYRICAVDQVGNVSVGIAGSLTRPEPPEFALSIGEPISNGSIISARLIQPVNGDQQEAVPLSGDVTACIGVDNACNNFASIPADGLFNVDLGNEEGEKVVVAQIRTSLGYRSGFVSSPVILDKTAPIDGQAHIDSIPGDAENMLVYWEGFADALSGVQNYTVVTSDSRIPSSCTDGTIVYTGINTEFIQPIVEQQQFYGYRICAVDAAYNVSEGVGVGKDRRLLPAASLVLNPAEEDPWTTDPIVIGQIVLEDPAQEILLDAMCIGFVDDGTDCTDFEPYTDSFAVDVDDGVDGEKSIFVWLRSIDGVVSRVPLRDTVILDRTSPNDGNADGEAGIKKVTLHWDNFSDEHTLLPHIMSLHLPKQSLSLATWELVFAWHITVKIQSLSMLIWNLK